MDMDLNIVEAEPFARDCGVVIGMKILTFCGVSVMTKRDMLKVQNKKGKLKDCEITVLFDPRAATEISLQHLKPATKHDDSYSFLKT